MATSEDKLISIKSSTKKCVKLMKSILKKYFTVVLSH